MCGRLGLYDIQRRVLRMIPWTLIIISFLSNASGFRIVCYFSNSAKLRTGMKTFAPENVDPFLCTHLVYSYAGVAGLHLVPSQPHDDPYHTQAGMYRDIITLKSKNPKLKVLLAVGDFMEIPITFSEAVQSNSSREAFANNLAMYLRARNFDGALMEWANLAAVGHGLYDKQKFVFLLKKIRKVFNEKSQLKTSPLILALTLPASSDQLERAYNVPKLVEEVDFATVRTLDMHTAENKKTGLSAALHSDPGSRGNDKKLSIEWVTKYFLSLGVRKDKINIGIPTYGRTFTLTDGKVSGLGAQVRHQKDSRKWWGRNTIMGFFEVCPLIWDGGSVEHIESQGGRYYIKNNLWISYEDIMSVSQKTCFIRDRGLGGMTFWTLDLDDFSGEGCWHGKYPLIRTAVNLMTYPTPDICTTPRLTKYVDVPPPWNHTKKEVPLKDKKVVVCQYTNWAQYRHGKGRFLPENINPNYCTHIVYAYAVIKNLRITPYLENDESKPWLEGMYGRVIRRKKINPNLKVLLGVGGGQAGLNAFDSVLKDKSRVSVFVQKAVLFLRERNFDGLELTWQRPTQAMRLNFIFLIELLRSAFDNDPQNQSKTPLILTVAMQAGKKVIDEIYQPDIIHLANLTDFLSLMTYNFHGYWDGITGHNAPLCVHPREQGTNRQLNVKWVVDYYLSLGVPSTKMTLSIPTYAQTFTLSQPIYHTEILAPTTGPGNAGFFTRKPGILAFYEVCDFLEHGASLEYVDSSLSYHAVKGTQWVSFDDYDTVHDKVFFAMTKNLSGVNVQSLDLDDFAGQSCDKFQYPLLKVVYDMVLKSQLTQDIYPTCID